MDMEHLTAVCTGLGSVREDVNGREVYVKHADCLANLRHLQRFLRRDDQSHRDIFMQLGKWNTIRQDILPIIIHYRHNYDLVLNAVKVMVFLTMPVDPSSFDKPQQLEYLRQFKAAVLEDDAIGVIVSHLQDPLEHIESGSLTDMDGKMFQLVLTLIRNLLAVDNPSSPLVRASVMSNPHVSYIKDELIERLFKENVMDLILALTHHVGGDQPFLRQDNLLILEILNYLYSGQMPDIIASSREQVQKQKSQSSPVMLEALVTKEREERRNCGYAGPRHSNFCGMFVRVEKDGSKTILTRNPYQSPLDNLFQKPEIKRGLVKKVATDLPLHLPSNSTVCGLLKGFANQLLEGSYNVLMQTVKEDIRSERNNVQSQDIVMLFTVVNFFTAYQRCLLMKMKPKEATLELGENHYQPETGGETFQGQCGRIASTMDEDMFILVTMKWRSYMEEAKLTNDWFPPTSAGVLVKEMIHMLDYIVKASDEQTGEGQQEVRVARILLYKVFYDQTENGILMFLFQLIKTFDVHKQPRSQLAGLIETAHIVLRLLDFITKQDGALRVKKKARSVKKVTKSTQNQGIHPSSPGDKTSGDENDPAISSQSEPNNILQAADSSVNVQLIDEADVSSIRKAQSRPGGANGSIQVADELHCIDTEKHLEDAELPSENTRSGPADATGSPAFERHDDHTKDRKDDGVNKDEERGINSDSDIEEEEEEEMKTKEETLDIVKCVKVFADNTVLHNYCWLLKNYLHNTPATNYYIVRMLQRICEDCKLEPMLYQLSILQTCYEILSNNNIRNSEQHQFVIAFLTRLVRHLFQKLKHSPLLFVDLLFWKAKRDCHCITADYIIHDLKNFSSKGKSVSKEVHFQDRRALLDSLGDDDDDMGNDADVPRVETLFRSQNSNGDKGTVMRQKSVKKRGPFSDFEEDLIKDLFEKHKDNRSCTKLVAQGLAEAGAIQDTGESFTPLQVGRALKRLGLARVTKKASHNKLLENIASQGDTENENDSGMDKARDEKSSDVDEHNEVDSSSNEGMIEVRQAGAQTITVNAADTQNGSVAGSDKIFSERLVPSQSRGLLETLDEDSGKDDERQNGGIQNLLVGGQKEFTKSSELKKRKSGVSDIKGGNDVPKRRRKRGLFSEEQDYKLQSLFEKYKGMTRFKHLIFNDLEGVFTPAQIGRRLRQLGCYQPKKRKSNLAQMSEDEEEVLRNKSSNDDEHRSSEDHDGSEFEQFDLGHGEGISEESSGPSLHVPMENEDTENLVVGTFKSFWGSSARKNLKKKEAAAVVQREGQVTDSSDDDVPIAQHLSMKKIFQRGKTTSLTELQGTDEGIDTSRREPAIGEGQPIDHTTSETIREGKEISRLEQEVEDAEACERPSDGSEGDDDQVLGQASHRYQKEHNVATTGGIGSNDEVIKNRDYTDGQPTPHVENSELLPRLPASDLSMNQLLVTTGVSDNYESDEQPISKLLAVTKTFRRTKRSASWDQSVVPLDVDKDNTGEQDCSDDELLVAAKKTYETKKRSSLVKEVEEKSTWGDSDTDASEIEDMQLLGNGIGEKDLSTTLQEVRTMEENLAKKSKKRRLERKHTLNIRDVDGADEVLITNSRLQGADGNSFDDSAPGTHLTKRKGPRKAIMDAMTSDGDE